MSQPPTAAIAVGSIFGGLAALFVVYRIYKKWWHSKHRDQLLPPIRQPPTAYHSQTTNSAHIDYSPYSSANSTSRASIFAPSLSPRDARHSSSPSEAPSPAMTGIDSTLPTTPSDVYDPSRFTVSSSSSTMAIKRTYAASLVKSSNSSQYSNSLFPTRRESYLPHSPLNRDPIQIVPPQPLGFGLGGLATALDQKTLAFSHSSGIGTSDDFSNVAVWSSHDSQAKRTHPHNLYPSLSHQERKRYLEQGPCSVSSLDPHSTPSTISLAPPSLADHSSQSLNVPSPSLSNRGLKQQVFHPNLVLGAPTLDAEHSPLQRMTLQSAARQKNPSHSRLSSESNSDHTGSPILAAFKPASALQASHPTKSLLVPNSTHGLQTQ